MFTKTMRSTQTKKSLLGNRPPPEKSMLSNRSLSIEELAKLHENLKLFSYFEPANEQKPYRPLRAEPMTKEILTRRLNQAH